MTVLAIRAVAEATMEAAGEEAMTLVATLGSFGGNDPLMARGVAPSLLHLHDYLEVLQFLNMMVRLVDDPK